MKLELHFLLTISVGCLLIATSGCAGLLQVSRYDKFVGNKDAEQMVTIDPEFDLNPLLQHSSDLYQRVALRVAKSNSDFNDLLARNARKNGIKLQVIDSRTLSNMDEDFFNYLAPLKRDILQSNFLQDFGSDKQKVNGIIAHGKSIKDSKTSPFISARYGHLAKRYGTRYFAVQGIRFYRKSSVLNPLLLLTVPPVGIVDIINPDMDAFYYTVIADVVQSRIVYREYRKVDLKNSRSDMNAIVYDSFRIVRK